MNGTLVATQTLADEAGIGYRQANHLNAMPGRLVVFAPAVSCFHFWKLLWIDPYLVPTKAALAFVHWWDSYWELTLI